MELTNYKGINEAIEAVVAFGVFDIKPLERDIELAFDKEGRLEGDSINMEIWVSIADGVVLSKNNFKQYVSVAPRYEWSGRALLKNANIRFIHISTLYNISKRNSKRSNEYHKEVLDGRLSGAYKKKFRDGLTWNAGGHETGDAKLRKEARKEKCELNKATPVIPAIHDGSAECEMRRAMARRL